MLSRDRLVHVVDGDAAARRSIERLLRAANFTVVCYASATELLSAAAKLTSGCIILDIRLSDMDGLPLQARLGQLGVHLPVLVMTSQGDAQTAVRAMKAGAADFIEKQFADDVLISAIEAALHAADSAIREGEAAEAVQRVNSLSRREREVLDALVSGHSNKVIAYDLGISARTVEVHRARMMERLGVRQLAEAIRLAVIAGLR